MQEELQRLLDAAACCESPRRKLQPYTLRMILWLLHGAGMRIGEPLFLALANVDLTAGILTIRERKFYKTRLAPMSPAPTGVLSTYMEQREKDHPAKPDSTLFLTRSGNPVVRHTAEDFTT